MLFQLSVDVRDVDGRDHAIAEKTRRDERLFHQGVDDWRRISEAGGFNQHPFNRTYFATRSALEQVFERAHEIASHAATDTARIQYDEAFVNFLDEVMVHRHFAELVDEHGGSGQTRGRGEVTEQGGFSGAQKAGEDDDGKTPSIVLHGARSALLGHPFECLVTLLRLK